MYLTYINFVSSQSRTISIATQKSKSIENLGQWCCAFYIYITILCQEYPQELQHLTTYMNTIKNLARHNGIYLMYDEEFRSTMEYWTLVGVSGQSNS